MAEIVQVSDGQRGRFLISCVGRQRFRIRSISDELPYLSGSVELLAEEADQGVTPELTAAVREAVAAYLALISGLGGGWVRDVPVPTEPVSLSYLAAAALQVDTAQKQTLLEETTASSRLRSTLSLLHQSTEELRRRVEEGAVPEIQPQLGGSPRHPPSIPFRSKTSASLAMPSPISSGVL